MALRGSSNSEAINYQLHTDSLSELELGFRVVAYWDCLYVHIQYTVYTHIHIEI